MLSSRYSPFLTLLIHHSCETREVSFEFPLEFTQVIGCCLNILTSHEKRVPKLQFSCHATALDRMSCTMIIVYTTRLPGNTISRTEHFSAYEIVIVNTWTLTTALER